MDFIEKMVEQFLKLNRKMKRWQRAVSILGAVVVFASTYMLVLPAITLDKDTASTQAGIEVAASENDPSEDGTVYEAEAEEAEAEAEEEVAEDEEEASSTDSGSDEAEAAEEEAAPAEEEVSEEPAAEEPAVSEEDAEVSEDAPVAGEDAETENTDETEAAPEGLTEDAAIAATDEVAAEVELITEETQLIYEGKDYKVYADFDAAAKLPVGVELQVKEITQKSDPEAYKTYYDKSLAQMQEKYDENTTLSFAKFYDISFIYNGVEVEPAGDVKVKIEYEKAVDIAKETAVDAIHFGKDDEEKAELIDSEIDSEKKDEDAEAVKSVEFESDRFSVYGVVGAVAAEPGVYTFTGEGYVVRVTIPEEAQLPLGTQLVVSEIDKNSDEYVELVGKTWIKVNREYFEVQEMRENYNEAMGYLPDVGLLYIDDARFFNISFVLNDEEVKPNASVLVDVELAQDLSSQFDTTPGEMTYSENGVEIIENTDKSSKEDGAVSFRYELNEVGNVGAYISRETHDGVIEPSYPAAPAPRQYSEDVIVKSAKKSDKENATDEIIESALETVKNDGKGEIVEAAEDADSNPALAAADDLNPPKASKTLTPNNDGTYTLSLNVTGESKEKEVINKANVLIVMDRSSSMVDNYQTLQVTQVYNAPQPGVTYYGREEHNPGTYRYFPIWQDNSGNWRCPQYSYTQEYPDTANVQYNTANGIFTGDVRNRLTAEQSVLGDVVADLLSNNGTGQTADGVSLEDIIEISVICFGNQRFDQRNVSTEVDWTTNYQELIEGINNKTTTTGTNWEDGLQYAKSIADSKYAAQPDEALYVIFITDGEPTAVQGETTGAIHWTETNGTLHEGGFGYAYDRAIDDARNLIYDSNGDETGYVLHGIFTYGRGAEQLGYLRRLIDYAYNGTETETSPEVQKYFHDASDEAALRQAFANIISEITQSVGYGRVVIEDGVTKDAAITTIEDGTADGFIYTVTSPGGAELYHVEATGGNDNPTVTFTIDNNKVPGVKKTYTYTDENGNTVSKDYYSATVGSTEYKMALATIDKSGEVGQVKWDLSGIGTLLDGYTYTVSFVIWPNQDAYDYAAGLNNNLPNYIWDEEAAEQVQGKNYEKGGVHQFPSIVKYNNGGYGVLTNTDQEVTYYIVRTETIDGVETTTYEGPYTLPLETPDPMPLEGTTIDMTKNWEYDIDPEIMDILVAEAAAANPPRVFGAVLNVLCNGLEYKSFLFTPTKDAQSGEYSWNTETVVIAPALLTTKHPGGSATYKRVTLAGKPYYVLNDGHDYTITEEDLDYHFEFSSNPYHPALVDGILYNVEFETDSNGIIVDGSTASYFDDEKVALEQFDGTNTIKGRLLVTKEVDIDEKSIGGDVETATFDITINLTDKNNNPVNTPSNMEGIAYQIDYGKYNPNGVLDQTTGTYGSSAVKAISNGTITESIYAEDTITVINIPTGTKYDVSEDITKSPEGWIFKEIVYDNQNKVVIGNQEDTVTVKNTLPSYRVNILKVAEDGVKVLEGAEFDLYGEDPGTDPSTSGITPLKTKLTSDSNGNIELGTLAGGTFYLVETTAPMGYNKLLDPITITVDGTSTQKQTGTNYPLYVTYSQTGNAASADNSGVIITTEGSGDSIVYIYTLTVVNTPGVELPFTGGPGTLLYTLSGMMLIFAAAMMYGFRMRRRERRLN